VIGELNPWAGKTMIRRSARYAGSFPADCAAAMMSWTSPLQGGAELIQESDSDFGVAVVLDCAAPATPTDRTPYWFMTG